MKTSKIVFASLFIFAATAFAAAEIFYQTTGLSEFKFFRNENDQRWVSTTLQNYELYREYQDDRDLLYLVDSRVNKQYPLDAEGVTGAIQWNVRTGDRLQTPVWNKSEFPATGLSVDGNWGLVITELQGCCASMTGYRAYNVKTGQLLISYNDLYDGTRKTPFVLDVPNSPIAPRFVGLITVDGTRDLDFQAPTAGMEAASLIKYASRDGVVYQKLQVDTVVADGWGISVLSAEFEKDPDVVDSDKIEIRDGVVNLWNIDQQTDPAKIEGVRLSILVNAGNGDKTIKIPIRKDRLSLDAAQIPDGVSVRAL